MRSGAGGFRTSRYADRMSRAIFGSVVWVLACVLVAGPAAADPDPDSNPNSPLLETLTRALAHPDWETREAATERLMSDPDIDAADVARALGRTPVAEHEAHARLRAALDHRILDAIRRDATEPGQPASLGIRHRHVDRFLLPASAAHGRVGGQPADDRSVPAVHILDVLPGFPAAGVLRPGDVVVASDGRPLPAPDGDLQAFGRAIQSRRVGDTLRLDVVRGTELLRFDVRLGGLPALQRLYDARNRNDPSRLAVPVRAELDARRDALLGEYAPPD